MWEHKQRRTTPTPGDAIPKKKSRNESPGFFPSTSPPCEKGLPPFLSAGFLRLFLGGLLRLRFSRLFLWRGFLFGRFLGRLFGHWLGCCSWGWRFFLGLFADHHQILFLGFDDFFRFARQLLVVLQPRQLVVVFEIVLLEIHSILPWENPWGPRTKGPFGSLFWRELYQYSTPSVSRCYRTRRALSSILRCSV